MIERRLREKDTKNVVMATGDNKIKVPVELICQAMDVGGIIRVPEDEYPRFAKYGLNLTHFGLPIINECRNKPVILARIVNHGVYLGNGNQEELPTLSFDDVWKVQVAYMKRRIGYEDIKPGFFENTVGNIRSVDELQHRILTRYAPVLKDITDQEILALGVSIRSLRLIETTSFSYGY